MCREGQKTTFPLGNDNVVTAHLNAVEELVVFSYLLVASMRHSAAEFRDFNNRRSRDFNNRRGRSVVRGWCITVPTAKRTQRCVSIHTRAPTHARCEHEDAREKTRHVLDK